jgi:chromosome segregation ATPase
VLRGCQRPSYMMWKNNQERVEFSGESSTVGAAGGGRSRIDGNGMDNRIESENRNGVESNSGFDDANIISGGRNRSRGDAQSQPSLDLGPYTENVDHLLQNMRRTHNALKDLSITYGKHVSDINKAHTILRRCKELEEICKDKDEEIQEQQHAIRTLEKMDRQKEDKYRQQVEEISTERVKLAKDRADFEKTRDILDKETTLLRAELKSKQEKELKELIVQQKKQFESQKEQLEEDMKKKEDEGEKRLIDLDAVNRQLSVKLEARQKQVDQLQTNLTEAQENIEDLKQIKTSLKIEKQELETRLKKLKEEFALSTRTTGF